MDYEIRTLCVLVVPQDQPTFSEYATEIKIVDEAAGEFLEVSQCGRTDLGKIAIARATFASVAGKSQCGRTDLGKIAISPQEWPTLRDAIDRMINQCR